MSVLVLSGGAGGGEGGERVIGILISGGRGGVGRG